MLLWGFWFLRLCDDHRRYGNGSSFSGEVLFDIMNFKQSCSLYTWETIAIISNADKEKCIIMQERWEFFFGYLNFIEYVANYNCKHRWLKNRKREKEREKMFLKSWKQKFCRNHVLSRYFIRKIIARTHGFDTYARHLVTFTSRCFVFMICKKQ